MFYAIFDRVLKSDVPLPELSAVTSCTEFISIDFTRKELIVRDNDIDWDHEWLDNHINVSGRCKKLEDGTFLVSIPAVAQFQIDCASETIRVGSLRSASDASVRHALLDRVIPMMLGQQGYQILHASAVRLKNGKVVAFVGDSGQGKSTLAASLASVGAQLLTDDCLMVRIESGEVKVIPSYKGLRLKDDSAYALLGEAGIPGSVSETTDKKRLGALGRNNSLNKRFVLDQVYLLSEPALEVNVCQATQASSLTVLVKQQFFLDVKNKNQIRQQFDHVRQLIDSGLAVCWLSYPRIYSWLPKVHDALMVSLHADTETAQ